MADELPDATASSGNKWRHDWYPYDDYLNVHRSYMDRLLDERLMLREHLTFTETLRARDLLVVFIQGFVECDDDVVVFVNKHLESRRDERGRLEVRGFAYNYHALRSHRDLLRYDNAHGDLHRHAFDLRSGRETSVELIDWGDLPTLDGVIREACALAREAAEALD